MSLVRLKNCREAKLTNKNKPKQSTWTTRISEHFMNNLFYTDVPITYQIHYSIILNNLYCHTYLGGTHYTLEVTIEKKIIIFGFPAEKLLFPDYIIPNSSFFLKPDHT